MNHVHLKYDWIRSSSFQPVIWNKFMCKNKKYTQRDNQCEFYSSYMEGSEVNGIYIREILTLGTKNNYINIPITFGCTKIETNQIFNQDADGIIGLGDGRLSLISQFNYFNIPKTFGICLSPKNEGVITFGSPPYIMNIVNSLIYTKLIGDFITYFYVKITNIELNGTSLVEKNKKYENNCLIDTGSSDTLIPKSIFIKFKKIIEVIIKGKLSK